MYAVSEVEATDLFKKLHAAARTDLLLDYQTRLKLDEFLDSLGRNYAMTQDCSTVECAECDDESCSCRCHWAHELMPEQEEIHWRPEDDSTSA